MSFKNYFGSSDKLAGGKNKKRLDYPSVSQMREAAANLGKNKKAVAKKMEIGDSLTPRKQTKR